MQYCNFEFFVLFVSGFQKYFSSLNTLCSDQQFLNDVRAEALTLLLKREDLPVKEVDLFKLVVRSVTLFSQLLTTVIARFGAVTMVVKK